MIVFTDEFKHYVLPWLSLCVCLYLAWYFYKHVFCALHDKYKTRRLIHKKQKDREHAFQKLEHRFKIDTLSDQILQLPPDQLLTALRKRKLTATQVLDAFIAKALESTKSFNSVTEFIPQAHIWAAQLDEMKDIKGPLHGLPISLSDPCNVEGLDSSLGFASNLHSFAENSVTTCPLVQALMGLGAVPFCKTNVPQALISWGCDNPIFGQTKNPLSPLLTPGIGEGSLIASSGSVLGLALDLGGGGSWSSHFCGIASIKPTKDRISRVGLKSMAPGIVGISGVPSLLCRSADLLASTFKELAMPGVQEKYDLLTLPIAWDEKTFTSAKPLRIGYFTSLPYFPLLGDTEKIIIEAKTALEAEGHTLLNFQMPDSLEMVELISDFLYADGGKSSLDVWKSEPIASSARFHYWMNWLPLCAKKMLARLCSAESLPCFSPTLARFCKGGATASFGLWNCVQKRDDLLRKVSQEWDNLKLDLLICPVFPFPAVPARDAAKLQTAFIYTMIWNLFDFPTGVVQFGTESGESFGKMTNNPDFILNAAQKSIQSSTGMPVGIQVVGLPFKEELVLRGMKELEYLSSIK